MSNPSDEEPAMAKHIQEISAKRRKIRKGTRSCWECKRRKIRCIFASSEDVTCLNCQRRRVPCVSQEVPEDLSIARKSNWHLGERIAKVEDLMKDILAGRNFSYPNQSEGESQHEGRPSASEALAACSSVPAPSLFRAPPTLIETLAKSSPNAAIATSASQAPLRLSESESAVLHQLYAAFPVKEDADILLRASNRTSLYINIINFQPHGKLTQETLAKPYPMTSLPGPNSHPIVVAECMLRFAITLQSPTGEKLHGLSEPKSVIMRRLVVAATTWVTINQDMHATLESLICIMLEGVFEINCGNLRRAWGVYRRAMTVAQLMGLHRYPVPPLKRIDPVNDADPEFMWFRIVYMDRYLSLLLGLPQGSSEKSLGDIPVMRDEPPLGKFERLLTVVASRILERNESTFATSTFKMTQSIDSELLRISKNIPASFWRPANFHGLTQGSPETLLETVRLAAQVYYYSILIQLHLPYMMQGISDNSEHEYSKITCVNASREIMIRFIAHRSFNPMSSCSRPVDFFALLAAMTLLLAHIDAHYHHKEAANFLAHQRLSDRALLDQALERMDIISNLNKDETTDKSAKLIRRLLDIEADAAEGNSYSARSVRVQCENITGGVEKEGEELHLNIPYLGIVKIARQGPISREPFPHTMFRPHQAPRGISPQREPTVAESNKALASLPDPPPIDERQSLYHTNNMSQSSTSSEILPPSEWPNWQLHGPGYEEQSMLQYFSPNPNQDDITLQPHAEVPAIATDIDEWAFQGVDMAFFDSLMRGTSCVDVAKSEQGIGG